MIPMLILSSKIMNPAPQLMTVKMCVIRGLWKGEGETETEKRTNKKIDFVQDGTGGEVKRLLHVPLELRMTRRQTQDIFHLHQLRFKLYLPSSFSGTFLVSHSPLMFVLLGCNDIKRKAETEIKSTIALGVRSKFD